LEANINMLLIVDPMNDLPAAQEEGKRIQKRLGTVGGIRITQLSDKDATWNQIRSELRSGKYDVVHYAGHAYFDPNQRSNSGIYCYGGQILSGNDLAGLERLPALAFFNACQAGRVRGSDPTTEKTVQDQIDQNVGLAEAFLRGGVANYVGTHWKVNDNAAELFATQFYTNLLKGWTTAKAIKDCRNAIMTGKTNQHEFANYIHYGNPTFVLKER
jgi:CHAT domain-containing protein